ncbi:MAG: hypothetical protein FJX47_06415 [Alphaproteobacteria bacterium]|nr:hypothetical protein [Alphaproteobacteria bacterium]
MWRVPSAASVAAFMSGRVSPAAFVALRHPRTRPQTLRHCDPPLLAQEIWAAGVTYRRSAEAWVSDSRRAPSAYDLVYAAPRPQIFFKAAPGGAVGHGGRIGLRADARITNPEAELVVVADPKGRPIGYTLGNDVSARDIEAENPLYQPQSKVFTGSAAIGPCLVIATPDVRPLAWRVNLTISRKGKAVFAGECGFSQLKRSIREILGALYASHDMPGGAACFTGTGIVVPDEWALEPGDRVAIVCPEIGELVNVARRLRR